MTVCSRRLFLKRAAIWGAGALTSSASQASASRGTPLSSDRKGVLVDTTVCVGCRQCELACKKAHGLPAGDPDTYRDRNVFKTMRRPSDTALTVINEFKNPKNELLPIDVKVQCMHCDHPACVSACIVGALEKQENGAVLWDSDKCIGCRYCMVACPFQIPQFEYAKALQPEIRKCDFCFNRTREGKLPACVEICPLETMMYGPRAELIKIAREKIRRAPDRFIDHILGEKEVNGTSWIYLASRDFAELGFPRLPDTPAPGVSESIQHGIFAYFFPPVMYYSLLGAVMWLTKKHSGAAHEKGDTPDA